MRKLLSTYLITAFCGWTAAFLVPLIIQHITGSGFYTAVAYAISFLPYLIMMPFFGVLGDHVNKKYMIQFGELANIALVTGLILTPFEPAYLSVIWLLYFGLSTVVAIHYTTFQAVVPDLISEDKIGKFNTYAYAINNIIGLVAPLIVAQWLGVFKNGFKPLLGADLPPIVLRWLGGLGVFKNGFKPFLGILIVGYFICMVLIQRITYTSKRLNEKLTFSSMLRELKEGFDYLRGHAFFKYTTIHFFFANFAEVFIYSGLINYLKKYKGIATSDVSYYYIPMGLGALIGSALALRIIARVSPGKIILGGSAFSIGCLSLMWYFRSITWMTTIAWGLHEVGNSVTIIAFFSLRQRIVPSKILSRVIVISRTLSYISAPIAAMMSGWLLDYTGDFTNNMFISIGGYALGVLVAFRALFSYRNREKSVSVKVRKTGAVAR